MTSLAFENAPIVELIAEIRWKPVAGQGGVPLQPMGGGPAIITASTSEMEEFFTRFGAAVHGAGHADLERLVPQNFPIMHHQPVYRFKNSGEGGGKSLYQIGPGLFTANAVPPYKTWSSFEPVIRRGVEALLSSRPQEESNEQFFATNLRYIDAFGPALTEGRSPQRFVKEVLGISIDLPEALMQHLSKGSEIKPFLQVQIPMDGGMMMTFGFGEGAANGEPGIIMDTSVATTIPVEPNVSAVMDSLNVAHAAIRASFVKFREPLAHLMPRLET